MRKLAITITPEIAADIVKGVTDTTEASSKELELVNQLTENILETSKPKSKKISSPSSSNPVGKNTAAQSGEMRRPKTAAFLSAPITTTLRKGAPGMPYAKVPEVPSAIKGAMNVTKMAATEELLSKAVTGLAQTSTHAVLPRTGKAMKIIGNNLIGRPRVGTPIGIAEDFKANLAKYPSLNKMGGVVDRTVAEIQELQHGYRFMRNPYAEAADSSRSRDFINAFKAAALKGGLAEKAGKTKKDFDPKSLAQGAKVESEHTSNQSLREEIAMDHLTEDPHYYEKLQKMEKKSEAKRFNNWWKEHPLSVGAGMIGTMAPSVYVNIQNLKDENKYLRGLSTAALGLTAAAIPVVAYRSIKNHMELEKKSSIGDSIYKVMGYHDIGEVSKKSGVPTDVTRKYYHGLLAPNAFLISTDEVSRDIQNVYKSGEHYLSLQKELKKTSQGSPEEKAFLSKNKGELDKRLLSWMKVQQDTRTKWHALKNPKMEKKGDLSSMIYTGSFGDITKVGFIKQAFIRHEGGKYVVYSHSGKHMGTYASEGEAKQRLQQIEYFKKQGEVDKNMTLTDLFTPGKAKGPGPELWKEDPRVDVLSKGASLEMDIYKRNRKTLLS